MLAKISKTISMAVLSLIMICGICLVFTGCDDDKDKKYDVAIRIGCSDGNVYEFPVGTDELHVEFEYDGIERTFGVRAYNLPDHPRWSEDWLTPSGEGANVFSANYLFTDINGNQSNTRIVKETGNYRISYWAESSSDLWNERKITLIINIK